MKYTTVEDVIASFPHSVLPTVQGDPDYQTIYAIRKSLQANSRAIDTHLGGGTLGQLGLIVSDACYAMIAPETDAGPTIWVSPTAPGVGSRTRDRIEAGPALVTNTMSHQGKTYSRAARDGVGNVRKSRSLLHLTSKE
jgi:hypothetical protein